MQDPSSFYSQQIKSQANHAVEIPQFPEHEHLKCPRCDSTNTKFCYYNNYNLSQPRHYCKSCRRYWTKGGVLRNIPVGGGSRKSTKRSFGEGGGGEAAEPSAKRAAVGSKGKGGGGSEKLGGEAEATTSSSALKKGEGEEANDGAGHFGHLMDAGLGTLPGSSHGGHFGNFVDDGVEFLNVDGDGGGGEGWSGNSNGWSGFAMYTPDSFFRR